MCFSGFLFCLSGVSSRQRSGADGQSQHHRQVQHQTSGSEGCCCTGFWTHTCAHTQVLLGIINQWTFCLHQVPVMIYPEPGLADQFWIPWWIILIAVLAGILLLTLLICLLWKVTHTIFYTRALKTQYFVFLIKKKPNQLVLACYFT